MLDIAGLGSSPTKLLEALEKLGVSKGADLRSSVGPGGSPDAELVKAFEDALNMPQEGNLSVEGEIPGEMSGPARESVTNTSAVEAPDERIVERNAGVDQAEWPASPAEKEPDEIRGRLDPGPAERIPGDAILRYERPEIRSDVVTGTENAFPPDSLRGSGESSEGTGGMQRIGEKEVSPAADVSVEGKKLPEFSDSGGNDNIQELARLLEEVTRGNTSAMELYRLQYLVGMLQVQASSGMKVSQQAEQGIESLLKQQG